MYSEFKSSVSDDENNENSKMQLLLIINVCTWQYIAQNIQISERRLMVTFLGLIKIYF